MTRIGRIVSIIVLMALCANGLSAAEKIKKEKLQVFILLGQSNMVGLADIKTFQYLLQDPYKPGFEEVEDNLKMHLYYRRIYSDYGYELEQKMHRDPKYFTMHPRTLRGVIRKTIIDTMPEDLKACGGNVKFTIYREAGHGISGRAYRTKELYEWLLEQSNK